ncbi:hypothetical protein ACFZBU_01825 [Embleya sp. NPDC008237]|uniref:hypothetical protein n=1 Tax=Embleya sp. NPDC008237 TaxID=3363978 RepID=UPI0036F04ED8
MNVNLITELAATPTAVPAGGSPVAIGSGILLVAGVYYVAKSRGAIFLVLVAFIAGTMLSGSYVSVALAGAADHIVGGIFNGVASIAS